MNFARFEQFMQKQNKKGESGRTCTVQGLIWPAGGDG
jgi:hypothetical protein